MLVIFTLRSSGSHYYLAAFQSRVRVLPSSSELRSFRPKSVSLQVVSPQLEVVSPQLEVVSPQLKVVSPQLKVVSPRLKVSSPKFFHTISKAING